MSTQSEDVLTAGRPKRQRRTPKRPDEDVSFAPKRKIVEAIEPRQSEVAELAAHKEPDPLPQMTDLPPGDSQDDPRVIDSLDHHSDLRPHVEGDKIFMKDVRRGYQKDSLFSKILAKIKHYKSFTIIDNLLYTHNLAGDRVLCIPAVVRDKRRLTEIVITQAHQVLGHLGPQKMSDYIHRYYWWPRIGQDVELYCKTCPVCQTTKDRTQKVPGLLHSLPIPVWPWDSIAMDFVGPFPDSGGYNYLWVVICRLTSMVHLVPIRTTIKASELAWIYVREIVQLHGLPQSIVSDRDSKFTSRFWRETHKLLGTKLLMSTSFHPQTDGASERAIRSISQILRALVSPDQRDWSEKVPMTEFAINSAVSSSSGFVPFELNSGYIPSINPGARPEPSAVPGVKHFVNKALQNLADAHDAIIESRARQTHYANTRRKQDDQFEAGDLVYVSTADLSLPKGRARKLMPKYIGPFKVIDARPEVSTYSVDLPTTLKARRIHNRFHRSRLRAHIANDDALFPHREAHPFYDFGTPNDQEWLVDAILAHNWDRNCYGLTRAC
jgi:Integrase zinc binding domain